MDLVINEMLPIVAKEKIANYIDIFCEKGYFSVEDTKRLLKAANKYGIKAKTHVNQFNSIGGVEVSVKLGALSVDHLEENEATEDYYFSRKFRMHANNFTFLFFLFRRSPMDQQQKMIERRTCLLHLATDYNPGS